jgi:hypothetical protein
MQRCMGIEVTDGMQCTHMGNGAFRVECPHLHYCAIHWRKYNERITLQQQLHPDVNPHHQLGMCHSFNNRTGWCGNPAAPESIVCQFELDRRRAEQEAEERRIMGELIVQTAFQQYMIRVPQLTWTQVIADLYDNRPELTGVYRYRIAVRYFHARALEHGAMRLQFDQYVHWVRGGRVEPEPNTAPPPPPPPPRQGLAAIAHDRQNVHTRFVSEQTNRGLETLLAKQAAHKRAMNSTSGWFIAMWLQMNLDNWPNVVRVGDDMWRWYTTRTCRTTDDKLYKRALDGLYRTIRDTPQEEMRRELYKRAWEECLESVGMCCDGHISRLCNVLVGFDDAFAPPVPFGELLQARMSSIAAMEIETDEKVRQATAFFNEFAVPEAERAALLDAF